MGELGALFNPGMRHEIEERESKANRREEEGNARDGDLRIDLASGVAVINIPNKGAADPKDPAPTDTPASFPASSLPVGPTELPDAAQSTEVASTPPRPPARQQKPAPTRNTTSAA